MTANTALIVSDDLHTAKVWGFILGQMGFGTTLDIPVDEDGTERRIPDHTYNLVVIDVNAQQVNPVNIIRRARAESTAPILLLLPQGDESQALEAYAAGADEVIMGTLSPRLFQAKARAWQRRAWAVPTTMLDSLTVGDLCLDPTLRQLAKGSGEVIRLTSLEYRLIHLLMSHPGQVLESSVLIARMWGAYGEGDNTLLKNIVYRLRRKIEPDPGSPRYIQHAAGEGYMLVPARPD